LSSTTLQLSSLSDQPRRKLGRFSKLYAERAREIGEKVLFRTDFLAMAIYMKCGSIDGQVTTAGFEKWIELLGTSVGIPQGFAEDPAGLGGRHLRAQGRHQVDDNDQE